MGIVDEIKEKLDIVDIIGDYIKLTKAGVNFKANCPFHKEKTPSFMVSPERQIWHCFGCNQGGDIFKFVMLYENVDFSEALRILAKKAGVELKKEDPLFKNQINQFYKINEKAAEFFEWQLKNHPEVINYLQKRGLNDETRKEWQLGFAPANRDSLLQFLLKNKFKMEDVLKTGLIIKSENYSNSYFDRFRNRIIFPIFNHQDKIVAFTGRIFGEEKNEAKYLNSPESPIFSKGQILYGFSKTKKNIREANKVLLVEGQMDFLMSWQSGIKYVVATSGTALTEDQLKTLKRLTKNLIIGYDMDEAGRLAAERAIDLAHRQDFQVSVVELPEEKDIADYILFHKEKASEIIEKAREANDYYYNKALTQYNLNNLNEKREALEFLLSKIAWIENPIERGEWLKKIAETFQIREEFLQEDLEKIQKDLNKNGLNKNNLEKNSNQFHESKSRKELLSEKILALAIKNQLEKNKLIEIENFLTDNYKKIADVFLNSDNLEIKNDKWEEIGYLKLLADYEFSNDDIDEEFNWNLEIDKIFEELKKENLKQLIIEKTSLLKEAEDKNDIEKINNYLDDLQKLLKGIF